ncbi:choloylglycine hydrolase, partial [Enterococcus faecalis]
YYYRTYDNSQITAVDMNKENLEKDSLIVYPMVETQQINYAN